MNPNLSFRVNGAGRTVAIKEQGSPGGTDTQEAREYLRTLVSKSGQAGDHVVKKPNKETQYVRSQSWEPVRDKGGSRALPKAGWVSQEQDSKGAAPTYSRWGVSGTTETADSSREGTGK